MKPSRPRPDQDVEIRPGILPGILGALATLSGLFLFTTDWFITVQFAVSILAAIMIAFAFQGRSGKSYAFIPFLALIVIAWNPIVNFTSTISTALGSQGWLLLQVAASIVIFVAGVMIKTVAPKG